MPRPHAPHAPQHPQPARPAPPDPADALRPVSCADCGRLGLEHETDVMPGVCPRCMDRRLLTVAGALARDVEDGRPYPAILARHYRRLREAGVVPAAASKDVRALAEALGCPVPREALATADKGWEQRVAAYLTGSEEGA